jgi:hypothetical protein
VFRDRKWLGSIRYVDGKMTVNERRVSGHGTFPPQDYAECLQTARNIFNKARKVCLQCVSYTYSCHYSNALCHAEVWGSGDEAPCSLNLTTQWRRVVRFMLWLLYPLRRSPGLLLDRRVGGWTPEHLWSSKQKDLCSY